MTDHLEELLEQMEQAEEEQERQWPVAHTYRLAAPAARTEGGAAEQGAMPAVGTQEEEYRARNEGAVPLVSWLNRLRQAVQRGQERTRNHSGAGVDAAHQGQYTGGLQDGRLTAFGAAHYAAMVDAAFQRDARRYDGPLGLL